ncbi:outer membrane lipoprotein-sorting protein [Phaeocystidibacter luteus]|uniref:Outer membrane lipoprotein-sorting protein n=1 Tax=Phaeocystidibacter luteus TaxID=911197 RepID=A0A6N6RJJ1_9FLAO|nr:outer membrane lipoprotein-sorting protein [Phaeocystidibacter luteus]KAB2813847.1 outer membrane lipoprotein-sorting protein [Phaeocystidibacter luteus]
MKLNKLTAVIAALSLSTVALAQDVDEIIRKSEQNLRGESSHAVMSINIVRPTWERNITAESWSEGSDYSLILIKAPARDRGTVFLKREREMWNYVPTINRQVKMPPSMMSQSWMGSDFNNDDLVRESSMVKDYTHTLLGKETIRGVECYKIESIPNDDAPVVWGKLISYITVEDYLQWKVEFYDEDEALVQTLEGFDTKEFGDRKLPARIRMTPQDAEGEYTEMVYESLEFGVEFDDNFFSVQNMKRVR